MSSEHGNKALDEDGSLPRISTHDSIAAIFVKKVEHRAISTNLGNSIAIFVPP